MAKRKKAQSLNFLAGAAKRIMFNKEKFNTGQLREMRQAMMFLAFLDGLITSEQLATVDEVHVSSSSDDAVLAELRTKFQGGATKNADTSSNV